MHISYRDIRFALRFIYRAVSSSQLPCQTPQNASDLRSVTGIEDNKADFLNLVCRENFFLEDGICKPNCNTWLMFQPSTEKASLAVIGICAVVGILTTVIIIILSFVRYRDM